jgi:putative redox protein
LANQGIGVLRFDFAGLGTSGGCFADSSFAANVDDLLAANQAMSDAGKPPALLIGHSLGGAAALAAAGSMQNIRAVATIGAPFDVKNVLRQFDPDSLQKIKTQGEAEVLLAGRPFVIRKTFVDDLERHDLGASIAGLGRALLVMHSPRDSTVDIHNAGQIFAAAKHPKSFISLDDADHLMRKSSDAEYAARLISAWVAHYLPVST